MARTPVLPEATRVGALSTQLRRPRLFSATSALGQLRSYALPSRGSGLDYWVAIAGHAKVLVDAD